MPNSLVIISPSAISIMLDVVPAGTPDHTWASGHPGLGAGPGLAQAVIRDDEAIINVRQIKPDTSNDFLPFICTPQL